MIGTKLEPVYKEINDALWEYEANSPEPPGFSTQGFKYATKIFMSALMEQVWNKQEADDVPMNKRCVDVEQLGKQVRELILENTGIDMHKVSED